MTKILKFWPVAAACVLAIIGLRLSQETLRHEGELREQVRALETRNAKLEDEAGVVDTAYVHDTVTFTRWRTRLDTLAVDIKVTDTVAVRQFIAVADSTVRSCSVALQTCEARVALRDLRIAVLDSIIAVKDKQRPGWLRRTFGCAAGVGATTQGAGLGAACGVRFP